MKEEDEIDPIKIVLVDDHQLFLDGLGELISNTLGFKLIAAVRSAEELWDLLEKAKCDLIILDIDLPADVSGQDGLEIAEELQSQVKVLFVSMYGKREVVRRAMQLGQGFADKNIDYEEMREVIQTIVNGGTYLSEKHGRLLLSKPAIQLTTREREVAKVLAQGKPLKHVASELCISYDTADNHRRSIFKKYNVHSVSEFTRKYIEMLHHTSDQTEDIAAFKKIK
jgi:DNA-binding NarL/FixJ family response regulator